MGTELISGGRRPAKAGGGLGRLDEGERTTMTKLEALARLGQSIWYDNIRRSLLESGELAGLMEKGVRGLTSNPSIFEKAIAGSSDYDEALEALAREGLSDTGIFEALAVEDIRWAADLLRPVYTRTEGADGYVSLEVSPTLAHETEDTIREAKRLFSLLDRPNVMIKVPATPAGIPAVRALIGAGVNVNVTLMFSLAHYDAVAEAYLSGLEELVAAGSDPSEVASVASFFVSRVDTAVDRELAAMGNESLLGKIAIANAKVAYARFKETFSGPRWEGLASRGARVQRPLWASTGTKNPHYSDTLYVDALIGPHTVNTVPPETLHAFLERGTLAPTLEEGVDEARAQLTRLTELGIDLPAITEQLQEEGVAAFSAAFEALLDSIRKKRAER